MKGAIREYNTFFLCQEAPAVTQFSFCAVIRPTECFILLVAFESNRIVLVEGNWMINESSFIIKIGCSRHLGASVN